MQKFVRTLIIRFDTEIREHEIPLFRGAVLKHLGKDADLLYHNHTGENTFRYAYPKIQYKRLKGKAAIVCVDEGVELIGRFLWELPDVIMIGERPAPLHVEHVQPLRLLMQTWNQPFTYHLYKWTPLNTANYSLYQAAESGEERHKMLENILRANLLSMLKGLGIFLEETLELVITWLSEPYVLNYKRIGMMAFNADFACNLSIPNHLGIGKNASVGFGVVHRTKAQNNMEQEEP